MTASARGFTLVEVLVAMAVFSLVAMMAAGIASASLDLRNVLDTEDDRVRQLQMSRAIMKADLAQLVWRPTRDAYGALALAGLKGGRISEREPLLKFVRGGSINPESQAPRSSLQYIEYVLEDNTLVRRSRAYLDPTPDTPTINTILIDDVREVSAWFLNGDTWQPQWQVIQPMSKAFPDAIAIDVTLPRLGAIRQVFMVPTP